MTQVSVKYIIIHDLQQKINARIKHKFIFIFRAIILCNLKYNISISETMHALKKP
jgi:hypothetical protein